MSSTTIAETPVPAASFVDVESLLRCQESETDQAYSGGLYSLHAGGCQLLGLAVIYRALLDGDRRFFFGSFVDPCSGRDCQRLLAFWCRVADIDPNAVPRWAPERLDYYSQAHKNRSWAHLKLEHANANANATQ